MAVAFNDMDGVVYLSLQSAGIANQWLAAVDRSQTFAAVAFSGGGLNAVLISRLREFFERTEAQ